MDSLEGYIIIWSGILVGMALASLFGMFLAPMPSWSGWIFFVLFVGLALFVRPFVMSMVVTP